MFKKEPVGGECLESVVEERNQLRTMNYWLVRTLERESLARHRAELDLRLLQMEVEDKRAEYTINEDSNLAGKHSSTLVPPSSCSSFLNVNNSLLNSLKYPLNNSTTIPCPKMTITTNFNDLKHNVTSAKDVWQKKNSQRKKCEKQKLSATTQLKQNKRTCDSKSDYLPSNKKKKLMKKQVARIRGSKSKEPICGPGQERLPLDDQRSRQYIFCKHCKEVRHLRPVTKRKGMPSAFRHLCKTPTGKVHVQRTIAYRSSTCRADHLGPCLRLATTHEIGQANSKVPAEAPLILYDIYT